MKIDRREPVNIYRKRWETDPREHMRTAAIIKYAALTLIGILLFQAGHAQALLERGYEALGGEVFALFLPVLYWMMSRIVRDVLNARDGKRPRRQTKRNVSCDAAAWRRHRNVYHE